MSLLTIIQDACQELNLQAPTQVIGNTDPQVIQLLALSNREGQEFSAMSGPWSGWPELNETYAFNLVPVGPYTGTMTPNSNIITNMSSTAGLVVNYGLAGNFIYPAAIVTGFTSNTVTMSIAPSCTEVTNNVSINFGQIQYPLPSDWQDFVSASAWDTNFRWQMLGPLSTQEQEVILRGISPVGPRIRWWINDRMINIQPLPGSTQTDLISFRYISTAWCTNSTGVPNPPAFPGVCRWQNDSDIYRWPENTQTLGVKWRFLRAKGLDYGEEYDTYVQARDRQMARSGSNRSLPTNASSHGIRLLSNQNVPDTGFGQ